VNDTTLRGGESLFIEATRIIPKPPKGPKMRLHKNIKAENGWCGMKTIE
jgi:hypothetical protein